MNSYLTRFEAGATLNFLNWTQRSASKHLLFISQFFEKGKHSQLSNGRDESASNGIGLLQGDTIIVLREVSPSTHPKVK